MTVPAGCQYQGRSVKKSLLNRTIHGGHTQHLQHLGLDIGGVHRRLGIHHAGVVVVDEGVGQHHGAEFQPVIEHALIGQKLGDMAAKAADRAFLDGDQRLVAGRKLQDQLAVQGLGETGIGHGRRKAALAEGFAGLQHLGKPCAKGEDRDAAAFGDDAALADLKRAAALGHLYPHPFAARIAEGRGAVIECGGVGYEAEYWRAFAEVRYGVIGSHAWVGDLGADAILRPNDRLTVNFGPRADWGSGRFMNEYFGISGSESVSSGLNEHNTSAGFYSVGVELGARYEIAPLWGVEGKVAYDRLVGDAGDSPITKMGSANQFAGQIILTRSISLGF